MNRSWLWLSAILLLGGCASPERVSKTRVPTGQKLAPYGTQFGLNARAVDLALGPDGNVAIKTDEGFQVWKAGAREATKVKVKGGTSLTGITFDSGGIWVSNAESSLTHYTLAKGSWQASSSVTLPKPKVGGEAFPCGFKLYAGGRRVAVAASRSNQLCVGPISGKSLEGIDVDIAPYDVVLSSDQKTAWVSCWGGESPKPGRRNQAASGTPVEVDVRGVAAQATVVQVDLSSKKVLRRVRVGLMPTAMALTRDGKTLYVANANADAVSEIDTRQAKLIRTLNVKPDPKSMFGSAPNDLALDETHRHLYVALGGANAIARLNLVTGKLDGLIPTAWYPTTVRIEGPNLWVATAKGWGSRQGGEKGFSVYGFSGTVCRAPLPSEVDLKDLTRAALTNSRFDVVSGAGVGNAVVPTKPGQVSKIKHVVYVLKENRTYDQIFGDLASAEGDPKLAIYGREVTPNHHALAEQFVTLDNFYCNGVLSADGHAWSMEGNATAYFERTFGGWTRSYPYGDDPLAVSATGFLWDHVLAAGKSFRNYGEFDTAEPVNSQTWTQLYESYRKGETVAFKHSIGVDRLRRYTHPDSIGWNLRIPDQFRADVFIHDVETLPDLPDLSTVYLPQDHTSGGAAGSPTPQACVADNDLALGRVVEAITKSKFWPETVIFVIEDDPQDGWDHIDGHRSICLVVSPFTKRQLIDSMFYNQTSMLHTICRILGIAPLNQMVAMSPPMTTVFTDKPDLTPYKALPNTIPLNQMNTNKTLMAETAPLNLRVPDAINENTFNRILWRAARPDEPYPAEVAGSHGKGLAKLGLKAIRGFVEDDDEEEDDD